MNREDAATAVEELLARTVRPNVTAFAPYASARDEFVGKATVYLDANENAFGSPGAVLLARYPEPKQEELRQTIAALSSTNETVLSAEQIMLGNGSDQIIDLLIRAVVRPGVDRVWSVSPSYGMYAISTQLQEGEYREVPLDDNFDLPSRLRDEAFEERDKLFFLCSPNNPTGNLLKSEEIRHLLSRFPGLVVVDEAYVDFADDEGMISALSSFPNLVLLRTFSKAWGLAGARIGYGIMHPAIREILSRIAPPYNMNTLTLSCVEDALKKVVWKAQQVRAIREERCFLVEALQQMEGVVQVYPSETNFLLVRFDDGLAVPLYAALLEQGIVVRDRSRIPQCEGSLRITVGTREENVRVLETIARFTT
ncbi:histidinol-phosphate transaminase [bacterium]|nr:histidinol-phosphate transaminase [bacterium]